MAIAPLPLHQKLMLLMLRDDTGTMEPHTGSYPLALGGAILAELMLVDAVSIDEDKQRTVRRARPQPLKDPILDECLTLVTKAKKPRGAAHWVAAFGARPRLRHRIAEQLCREGILEDSEDKVLFFFTRAVYPTIKPEPERQLVRSMREAVMGSSDRLDADTVLLIALAHATGLLPIHFERRELKERKERLKQITTGDLVGGATADAVRAAQQAAQAAAMSAIITSTVITPTMHG
ncbi:MAG: GPP34 family phosphoprotein [Planctomycetota bacterium]